MSPYVTFLVFTPNILNTTEQVLVVQNVSHLPRHGVANMKADIHRIHYAKPSVLLLLYKIAEVVSHLIKRKSLWESKKSLHYVLQHLYKPPLATWKYHVPGQDNIWQLLFPRACCLFVTRGNSLRAMKWHPPRSWFGYLFSISYVQLKRSSLGVSKTCSGRVANKLVPLQCGPEKES